MTNTVIIRQKKTKSQHQVASRGLWSAQPIDLNWYDFNVQGTVHQSVDGSNPHIFEEQKANIQKEVYSVSQVEFLK
jgi:hypothetical protein